MRFVAAVQLSVVAELVIADATSAVGPEAGNGGVKVKTLLLPSEEEPIFAISGDPTDVPDPAGIVLTTAVVEFVNVGVVPIVIYPTVLATLLDASDIDRG